MKLNHSVATAFMLVAIVHLFMSASFGVQSVRANPGVDDPRNVHLTYQGDPATSITVTWESTYSTSGDDLLYDTVSRGGNPAEYTFSVIASHHQITGAPSYIHDAFLTDLTPDTTYYLICGGPGNYSAERSFRTAPVVPTEFSFVIGGDSRSDPFHRSQVSEAMRHFNPSFVMHVGDMVEDGRTQGQWESWFADVDANWTGDNGLMPPIIPSLGNHEYNSSNYYEQFALPGNEQWYYYDWGPSLRIIVLNTESTSSQFRVDQVNWLESVLASTPNGTWKIVMFHDNVYYAGGHAGLLDAQQYWVPIFDKYHVNVVVQGHEHLYHRTKPLNGNGVTYSYREGTLYITAGGWGAPLHYYSPQSYSAYGAGKEGEAYHFILATVYLNGSMHLEAKGVDGVTFDDVWVHSPLKYWDFPNGMYVRVQNANITQPLLLADGNLTFSISALDGVSSTLNVYCANRGQPLTVAGLSLWSYDEASKMLTATGIQPNGTTGIFLDWVNHTQPEPELEPGPALSAAVVHGFFLFLAASALVTAYGVIRERRIPPRMPRQPRRPK